MSRPSHTTRVIPLRLPNEIVNIIERRAGKRSIKPMVWLRNRVVYDLRRKHGKR